MFGHGDSINGQQLYTEENYDPVWDRFEFDSPKERREVENFLEQRGNATCEKFKVIDHAEEKHSTEKGVLVFDIDNHQEAWFPKNKCTFQKTSDGKLSFKYPEWIIPNWIKEEPKILEIFVPFEIPLESDCKLCNNCEEIPARVEVGMSFPTYHCKVFDEEIENYSPVNECNNYR